MDCKITLGQYNELQLSINNLYGIYIAMPTKLDEYSIPLMIEIKRLSALQLAILAPMQQPAILAPAPKELTNEL